jgi:L-fuconolactonase
MRTPPGFLNLRTFVVIDAHIHLYDTTRPQGVPFPRPNDRRIYRPMLPDDIRQAATPSGVTGAVCVEASQWVEDNQWLLDLVAGEPFVCAVVGNLDPESPEFPALLERFAANPLFRGIRIRLARSLNFDHPRVRPNLEALAAARCTLDVAMRAEELSRLAGLASETPGLRIMLDHLGFVLITGDSPGDTWMRTMERFANLPNVYCKVSRFTEQAAAQPAPLEAAYYATVFDFALQVFGEDRLAFGSNWPPCLNSGNYATAVALARNHFGAKGERVLAKVMGRNAAAFYGGPRFAAALRHGDARTPSAGPA